MKATITNFEYATDLLERLIDSHASPTTLAICSTRKDFLAQIAPAILTPRPQEIRPSQESFIDDDPTPESNPLPHRLLIPTLQLLARSRTIKLVYCPSIDTLRAYLSSYAAPVVVPESTGSVSSPKPLLAILDLVLLHHATSEFSVQGLMRTFASAVEAANRNSMDLLLCECKDTHDPTNPSRGPRLWDTDVPLLSGSVRLGSGGSSFAGRMVSVRSVAGRWFSFEKSRRSREEPDDEEMLI
jgi:hypothetical protein